MTVRKHLHNNQDNKSNKIKEKNEINNSNNSKNFKNEHQPKKLVIWETKKVFILGDSMVKYMQGWEIKQYCSSMPCSGCSAFHGVNLNLKNRQSSLQQTKELLGDTCQEHYDGLLLRP